MLLFSFAQKSTYEAAILTVGCGLIPDDIQAWQNVGHYFEYSSLVNLSFWTFQQHWWCLNIQLHLYSSTIDIINQHLMSDTICVLTRGRILGRGQNRNLPDVTFALNKCLLHKVSRGPMCDTVRYESKTTWLLHILGHSVFPIEIWTHASLWQGL